MTTLQRLFHWGPRIICIFAILFVSLFALDSFAAGLTIWQQLGAFTLHLVPSFILTVLLIISWKWELIGGIIFILSGLAMSPVVFLHNYRINHFSLISSLSVILMITFPFIVVGILFIFSNKLKKKDPGTLE